MNFYFMMAQLIPHRTLDWQNMNITPIIKTPIRHVICKYSKRFMLCFVWPHTLTFITNIIRPQMPGLAAQLEAIM